MVRKIIAVIIGYIAMALVVMIGLPAAYFALGADRAFESGTYEITTIWLVAWGIVSIAAAVVGGIVCAKVSKHSKGAIISMMVLIGVLGAGNAAYMINREVPAENLIRTGDTSNIEAMNLAQSPKWVFVAEPIIGIIGAMFGAMMVCPCRKNGSCSVDEAVDG